MTNHRILLLGFSAALAAASAGCGGTQDETGEIKEVSFAAAFGDKPFSCTETFKGLGTTKSDAQPLDFRMYIHDVRLVDGAGVEVPFELEQDGVWQRDSFALLDFEDGTGTCKTGSPETRTKITGRAPAGDYTAVRFKLGLPDHMNHFDAATAPAPLNVPGLWWAWKGGYKYVRLDLETTGNKAYYFHLGSTKCDGSVKEGFSCAYNNVPEIEVTGFDPRAGAVTFDIASLYEGSNVDAQIDHKTDFVNGCMAFEGDPECPAVFERLGMKFESKDAAASKQSVFRAE